MTHPKQQQQAKKNMKMSLGAFTQTLVQEIDNDEHYKDYDLLEDQMHEDAAIHVDLKQIDDEEQVRAAATENVVQLQQQQQQQANASYDVDESTLHDMTDSAIAKILQEQEDAKLAIQLSRSQDSQLKAAVASAKIKYQKFSVLSSATTNIPVLRGMDDDEISNNFNEDEDKDEEEDEYDDDDSRYKHLLPQSGLDHNKLENGWQASQNNRRKRRTLPRDYVHDRSMY